MSIRHATLDGLIESYAVQESEFDVTLPSEDVIRLRSLASYGHLEALKREAVDWYKSLPKPGSATAATWPHPLPETFDDAWAAYVMHKLMVSPAVDLIQALQLVKAPFLVQAIMGAIDARSKSMESVAIVAQVEREKKASSETLLGESPSELQETPGESISTT